MLLANPIPAAFAFERAEIDSAIDQAVREAAEQGFHGHTNTPFILSRIKDLTQGRSLPANRALIESNVAMAAKVAVELSKFKANPLTKAPETTLYNPQQQFLEKEMHGLDMEGGILKKVPATMDTIGAIESRG